jgi:hypothetical protein
MAAGTSQGMASWEISLPDPLGDLEGLGGCGAGEQQAEFLAAETAAQVAVAQQVPHGGGDRGEHGVSGEVAVRVVDGFEVVDVGDGDRQRLLRRGGPGDLDGGFALPGAGVQEPGLGVGPGGGGQCGVAQRPLQHDHQGQRHDQGK